MRRRFPAVVAAGLAVALAVAGPALADEPDHSPTRRVVVRSVDTTDRAASTVTVMIDGERAAPGDFALTENGAEIADLTATPRATLPDQTGIVLAIDVSSTLDERGAFRQVKDAAQAFVAGRLPTDRVAIVSVGDTATVVQSFTSDPVRLTNAIEDLGAQPGAAVYDGLRKASLLLGGSPEMQANIVLVTDGLDSASSTTESQARGAAIDADAAVFVVGLQFGELNTAPYERLARETGGRVSVTDDPSTLPSLLDGVQRALQGQYVLTYPSKVERGPVDLTVRIGDAAGHAQAMSGASMSTSAVRPQPVDPPGGGGFFDSQLAKLLGGGLALVAASLFAYGFATVFTSNATELDVALQPYVDGYVAADEDDDPNGSKVGDSRILQRAVELTGQIAERRGLLASTEVALERAMLPLRAAEALFFWLALVVVALVVGFLMTGSSLGALFLAALALWVPPFVVRFKAKRRRKKFMGQLPDTLQLLSSTLRAGYSLMQGVEAVSQEVAEPMGHELRRVCTEARLGRPLEQALDDCAERMGSPDFAWAVMAIGIQREVGGNLSELLLTVADTMTQRERLRRDVATLTAEGKVSAIVLGILPVGLGVVMWALNPEYMGVLFEDRLGNILLGGSCGMALMGFWWMKKMVEIDI